MELFKRLVWVSVIASAVACSEVKFEKSPVKTNSVTPPTNSSGGTTTGGSSAGTSTGGSSTSGGSSSGSTSGGSSSGGSTSGGSTSGGSSSGGSSSGGSTSGSSSGGCDTNTITNLYDTSVTHHNPNQHDMAVDCIDGALDYNANIYFGPGDAYRSTRFGVTCASRWCAKHVSDGNSVGVIESGIRFNGDMLDLGASIPVECRSNRVNSPPGACETQIQNNPPLEALELWFPTCSPCGCDVPGVANHWNNGPNDLVNCATNYCTGLGRGFRWGILSEVSPQSYLIRCSRAAF